MSNSRWLFGAVCLAALLESSAALAQRFPGEKIADAKPGDLRVLVTLSMYRPFEAVKAAAEAATGKHIVAQYGVTLGDLRDMILNDAAFEVSILLSDVDQELVAANKFQATPVALARIPIAFAVRGDASNVKVGTLDEVKAAMLGAASVRYLSNGAGGPTARKVIGDLHIADRVRDNSAARQLLPLGAGEYEMEIYPISEIIANKTFTNLGPVLPELQVPAVIHAAIGRHANDLHAAQLLISFLRGPAVDEPFAASKLEKSSSTAQ